MNHKFWFLLCLILVACGGDGVTEGETAVSPLPTTAQPTDSPPTLPPPPTITPIPTIAVSEVETDIPLMAGIEAIYTPVPTLAPETAQTLAIAPPNPALEQAPYAASDCSDKYPCNEDIAGWEARLRVPDGFRASYFTRIDDQPSVMTVAEDGTLYVATLSGTIYTVDPAGNVQPFIDGFLVPTGLAFQPNTERLFVSARLKNSDVDGESAIFIIEEGLVTQLIGELPCCYTSYHAANGIAFGPDGYGYVGVGGRADHGEILDGTNRPDNLHPYEASILRFHPYTGEVNVYAQGFRNPYDIIWDASGQLYAIDNAPDYGPPDEFHRVVPNGQHGYPWYECDTCFPAPADVTVLPATYNFVPHSAPTGLTVYLGEQFPESYHNNVFAVLWSAFEGAQKVIRFGEGGYGASDFATGFAQPIDAVIGTDGAMYVADLATGIIFKIEYIGS